MYCLTVFMWVNVPESLHTDFRYCIRYVTSGPAPGTSTDILFTNWLMVYGGISSRLI